MEKGGGVVTRKVQPEEGAASREACLHRVQQPGRQCIPPGPGQSVRGREERKGGRARLGVSTAFSNLVANMYLPGLAQVWVGCAVMYGGGRIDNISRACAWPGWDTMPKDSFSRAYPPPSSLCTAPPAVCLVPSWRA